MSTLGRGKLIEEAKHVQVVTPADREGNDTLYNGVAAGSASGIDTMDFDEVNFIINAGTFVGDESVAASIAHSDTDDATASTALSGADFTAITTANDAQIHTASLRSESVSFKRYLFLKTVQTGTGTSVFSAAAILGRDHANPQTNSPVFDL